MAGMVVEKSLQEEKRQEILRLRKQKRELAGPIYEDVVRDFESVGLDTEENKRLILRVVSVKCRRYLPEK